MTFRRKLGALILGSLLALQTVPSVAQTPEDRTFRIEFQRGKSAVTIRESVSGEERLVYRFAAKAGQTIDMKLSSTTRLVEFRLYAPGQWPDGKTLAASNFAGAILPELNRYIGKAPASGDYRIVLRHLREVAPTGLVSSFRLDLSVTGSGTAADGGVATQLPGDTPVGEPEYWRVSGLKAGDKLNMRSGPGTSFRVIDQLAQGEVVKNESCAPQAGAQWCEVSRPGKPRESGWVSARYLVASSAPKPGSGQGATQLPGDTLVGGTGFNATGRLPCLVEGRATRCNFGVVRRGGGNATLVVDLPSGLQRWIDFDGGRPTRSNGAGGVYGEYASVGVALVFVGTTERFTVEDAILFGG
jgi:hypothetical protein